MTRETETVCWKGNDRGSRQRWRIYRFSFILMNENYPFMTSIRLGRVNANRWPWDQKTTFRKWERIQAKVRTLCVQRSARVPQRRAGTHRGKGLRALCGISSGTRDTTGSFSPWRSIAAEGGLAKDWIHAYTNTVTFSNPLCHVLHLMICIILKRGLRVWLLLFYGAILRSVLRVEFYFRIKTIVVAKEIFASYINNEMFFCTIQNICGGTFCGKKLLSFVGISQKKILSINFSNYQTRQKLRKFWGIDFHAILKPSAKLKGNLIASFEIIPLLIIGFLTCILMGKHNMKKMLLKIQCTVIY